MSDLDFDIIIIGGGINGAGIARDSAGRGLKVALVEKNNIGRATSSWSTKLIHGGLRYLENYEFKLVRESLKERSIIHRIAPSITKPIPFIIPHNEKSRSKLLIRLGLFLYDNLGGKSVFPKSSKILIPEYCPNILMDKFKIGFKYYDLQVNDQKLVELNVKDAQNRGAKIFENTKIINTIRNKNFWEIFLSDNTKLKSKIIINATGPWINNVLDKILKIHSPNSLRLVKGSHIITKRLYEKEIAFTFQNYDNRIIFIIPYENSYSLIGTTEVEVTNPDNPKISEDEIDYLINSVNNYLKKPLEKKDIKYTYSGIRPLIEDYKEKAHTVTRDYMFDIHDDNQLAPVISIFGGKLTTYRILSEKILSNLNIYFPNLSKSWTEKEKL